MMKKLVLILCTVMILSCEPYHYPRMADKLMTLKDIMEDGAMYECITNIKEIKYCSYFGTAYGFRFVFYDSKMEPVHHINRYLTMTAHDKFELYEVKVMTEEGFVTINY